jgi:pyruvate formate lyase activating enzyme
MYVTNIQRFSLDDGQGIRTTVFLAGCNMKCLWCHNPENLNTVITRKEYDKDGLFTEIYNSKIMSAKEIMDIVIRDKKFYDKSGGGLTVSGGEPVLQTEELFELLRLARLEGIHTAIETALNYDYQKLRKLLPYLNGVIADCKAYSEDIHIKCTGVSNRTILENISKLSDEGKELHIRIPIIPNINITFDEMERIGEFLKDINAKTIELLPYHKMGIGKYKQWNMEYKLTDIEVPDNNFMMKCYDILTKKCEHVIFNREEQII